MSTPRKENDSRRPPADADAAGATAPDSNAAADASVSTPPTPTVHRPACDFRTVCPNCGAAMHDRGCKTRCPRCHYFTDCSDPW